MNCIACGCQIEPADGDTGPICDNCRDVNPHATDQARMIAAAGDPTPEELAEMDDYPDFAR